MGNIATSGGAGGSGADECTAILAHVLAGETAITSDSGDEPGVGTMTVNSLLSFEVAAYSGKRVLAKWQNPRAAAGKPYSGVYIRYSASEYPGKTGGETIYKGAGNNTVSQGKSQTYLDLPLLNTKYYLSIYPYVTCSVGELTGDAIDAEVTTSGELNITFKGSQTYTMPEGYTMADVFCVGGGGNGGNVQYDGPYGQPYSAGTGGGGGYTGTKRGISIVPGEEIAVSVGNAGNISSFGNYCSAGGGGHAGNSPTGANGGSGGGGRGGTNGLWGPHTRSGSGGSDGSNGNGARTAGGKGQGSTTRAFGETNGTLYAGGGAGGQGGGLYTSDGHDYWTFYDAGGAGAGGGGGGSGAGSANTGGGGGGANRGWSQAYWPTPGQPGQGGSGVVLLRLY